MFSIIVTVKGTSKSKNHLIESKDDLIKSKDEYIKF